MTPGNIKSWGLSETCLKGKKGKKKEDQENVKEMAMKSKVPHRKYLRTL